MNAELEENRAARIRLLPLRVEHAEEMVDVLADPSLHTFIGGTPDTVEELRARYRRMVAGSPEPGVRWLNWVVQLRAEARLVGAVQATVTGDIAEVAWVVGARWQGRGIATEAARELVAWLKGQGIGQFVAHIHPEHHASAVVATACGLTPTDEWHDGEVTWRSRG
ncbi:MULTISPECIES: GNAT family N-acetyltransferase [unclassified Streptomyces]|uniref:GNAT family N-acetyltransferase n=1 Tax=unclassified Streptomyces TaxID=2593676 RepID=UPI00278BB08C|nr:MULTISPECIES: GNAT family N-acetyltransferase [unclassified Streptomyces]